ncbi:Os07g0621201 [Oryza sativa Japonica Group]|uniref:Os07g0621201 protein n=1 Tax=Oryza sativa subsp. japonica TaxID=39947 RepID=C7J4U4_ORYSJ|nr:Os07g0621201 [Oryza sativa Japonica Group]|eukprot:NP_001175301.1 Os07g0621201 [Oryza sativa Japonica Group]
MSPPVAEESEGGGSRMPESMGHPPPLLGFSLTPDLSPLSPTPPLPQDRRRAASWGCALSAAGKSGFGRHRRRRRPGGGKLHQHGQIDGAVDVEWRAGMPCTSTPSPRSLCVLFFSPLVPAAVALIRGAQRGGAPQRRERTELRARGNRSEMYCGGVYIAEQSEKQRLFFFSFSNCKRPHLDIKVAIATHFGNCNENNRLVSSLSI